MGTKGGFKKNTHSCAVGDSRPCTSCGDIIVITEGMAKHKSFRCTTCNSARDRKARQSKPTYDPAGKFTQHGHSHGRTWNSWKGMKKRCNNPNDPCWYLYGGRGIDVCERWDKFKHFFEDMGERPEGMTLDRIDHNRGYCKENCRWATPTEQMLNTRSTTSISAFGKTKSFSQWADEYHIPRSSLRYRVQKLNMSFEDALIKPIDKTKSKNSNGIRQRIEETE